MFERIRARMKRVKGTVRKEVGKKTDNTSETIGGYKDEIVGRMQERYETEKQRRDYPPPPPA
jgi:uncharacterized protein YjbJ (UPF0337 family)